MFCSIKHAIKKEHICNHYIICIYLPHEQTDKHIAWHLGVLLQWLQTDDLGPHIVVDNFAQAVRDIRSVASVLFPSCHARA